MQTHLQRGRHGLRLCTYCIFALAQAQYCAMIGNVVLADNFPAVAVCICERKRLFAARRSMLQRWATSRWASSCMSHRC